MLELETIHQAMNTNKSQIDSCFWESPCRQTVVLPGEELLSKSKRAQHKRIQAPPPPQCPPPIPSKMVRLVVLGDAQSGKTSLIQQFLFRFQVGQTNNGDRTTASTRKKKSWSVDYYKKDISYRLNNNEFACTRLQLWDISGLDSSFIGSDTKDDELNQLLQKASGIVLVLSCELGFQALMESISTWITRLKRNSSKEQLPRVALFVNKQDLLDKIKEKPSTWIRIGSVLSEACQRLGIQEWCLSSCHGNTPNDSALIESAMMGFLKGCVNDDSHGNTQEGRSQRMGPQYQHQQ